MTKKYRVIATDREGNPIRFSHNRLGTVATGDVLVLDTAIAARYMGTLLEECRVQQKRIKRVAEVGERRAQPKRGEKITGDVQEQKMDNEESSD